MEAAFSASAKLRAASISSSARRWGALPGQAPGSAGSRVWSPSGMVGGTSFSRYAEGRHLPARARSSGRSALGRAAQPPRHDDD